MLSKLRENGVAWLLKELILSFLRVITGNPPKVSPKPVAPGLINILALPDTFLNTLASSEGASPSKVTLVRLLQLEKADFSMLVTLSGILTLVRLLQPLKAYFGMLVTLPEIVTLFRFF